MRLPWAAGERLRPDDWKSVRMQLMFDCCKWDIQSEDHSVVADYPLFVEEDEWDSVARLAEKLSQEILAAEQELLTRPDLHSKLSLPASIQKILRKCSPKASPHGCARIMRFDFHFTPEGWRISEVNADVPGGFIEASGFTALMAEHYKGYVIPPDPTKAYVAAIRGVAGENASIGLIHATAHCDDRQVMQYLGKRLEGSSMRAVALSPSHLKWESGCARFTGPFSAVQPALLVRFFPAEWLPNLHPTSWRSWFCAGTTPMSNPGTAILIQSKGFPLVWDELNTSLNTWRSLLPETRFAKDVLANYPDWVFKPVFGRVGEDVAIAGVTEQRAYKEIIKDVSRHPRNWIAQRRFDTVPLETGSGVQHPCLGVFTLDSRAVGAYGRIATKPLIDHDAQDIAVLYAERIGKMTGKELFEIWAPNDSIWSQWVSPALFAQIDYAKADNPSQADMPELPWHERKARPDTAVVLDLPGADSVQLALALAWRGYRPVPIINASPGPIGLQLNLLSHPARSTPSAIVVLDMSCLVREICERTPRLQALPLTSDAPPAFVLDSLRLKGTNPLSDDMFDNRWMVFPQDFPSAKFLAEQTIKRVMLVQTEKREPQEDLSHVLLRWQEAGIEILSKASGDTSLPSRITVSRPSRFRASWYRALAIMGLRRSSVGGFGSFIPETSAAG